MTLKEADDAARMGLPVLYRGIEYSRISETGYRYNEKRERSGFIKLLDRNGRSEVYVDPALCTLKTEAIFEKCREGAASGTEKE